MKKLQQYKNKFIWNGIIRSVSIAYINTVISAVVKIKEIRKCPQNATPLSVFIAFIMIALCIGYIIISLVCLVKKRQRLQEKEVKDRIGNLYIDVTSSDDRPWSWLYYPGFLWRRVIFLMIPIIFFNLTCFQIQLLMLLNLFYVIWYFKIHPHESNLNRRMEVLNEVL